MGLRIRTGWTLSFLLLVAFALELVAVLSVPVTRKITLCEYGDYQFGVFGYCNKKTNECSSVGVGYDVDKMDDDKFSLPSNARRSLANLLIVHVIAAGLTLILLIFSLLTFIRGPSNSSRFLLFVLFFSIPTFLISLLAFLVDILLFVSHLAWGGWIVLGSTVLLALSSIILCIMRRTISSQKAMRRRMDDDPNELDDIQFQHASQRNQPEDDYAELKLESSTNKSGVTTNEDQTQLINDQASSRYTQSVTDSQQPYTSYQHAAYRAYRGNLGRRASDQQMPPTPTQQAPDGQYPPVVHENEMSSPPPAGTYPGYENADTASSYEIPSGNTYGPNVVPIPRLRESVGHQQPVQQHQHVAPAYAPQQAEYYDAPEQVPYQATAYAPEQAEYYGASGQAPYQATAHSHQASQPDGATTDYVAVAEQPQQQRQSLQQPQPQPQPQPEQQHHQAAGYMPPRRQWQGSQPQHIPGQMVGPSGGGRRVSKPSSHTSSQRQYFYEDTDHQMQQSPRPPSTSSSAYPEAPEYHHQYQQQPQTPQHRYHPTRSEMVIQNNPDFQLSQAPANRRPKHGPSNTPNQTAQESSSASSQKAPGKSPKVNNGMPAAFATSDSPFAISRPGG